MRDQLVEAEPHRAGIGMPELGAVPRYAQG